MKCLYFLVTFLFAAGLGSNAQDVAYTWANRIGGASTDISYSIAVDATGNVYLTGYYFGTVDFDPGAGVTELTSVLSTAVTPASTADIFLAKYTTDGILLWVKSFGGTSTDYSRSVSIDPSGNVYIAGYFYSNPIDFDPGVGITNLAPVASSDIFYAKYSVDGALLYARSFGGTGTENLQDMDVPAVDQIYLIGYYSGSMTILVNGVNTTYNSTGSYDTFFGRFDNAFANATNYGNAYTLGAIGGVAGDTAPQYGFGIKGGSNIFITGQFYGTCDFNPSATISSLTSSGGTTYGDAFIARYTLAATTPTYSWARQLGGGVGAAGYDVSFNNVNNIYVTGQFSGTVDFNPAGTGVGAVPLTSAGGADAFIAKYYYLDGSIPNNTAYWAKAFGGTSTDYGRGIYVDVTSGNSYVSGYFVGSVDFDPGPGISSLTSAGGYDVYFAKYGSDGSHIWSKRVGGTSSDYIYDAPAVDGSGNVYATGFFYGTADFDPSPTNAVNLTPITAPDIYFARYSALSAEPGNQPTALTFNPVTSNSISGSFTAAVSAPSGYLVLRKAGSAPTFTPEDGTSYTVNSTLSDGSVVAYAGSATSFTTSGLAQTTAYYFKVYSYNNNGLSYKINYNINSPLANNATTLTLAVEPTAQPTSLTFSVITSNSMTVGWTAASPVPTGGYLVVRRTGAAPSPDPVDGLLYIAGSSSLGGGTVIYIGAGTSINESSLAPGDYHYKVYSFNGSGYTSNFLITSPLYKNQGIEPSTQPTSATFTSLNQTSFYLNYITAVGGASGYLIIRKVASSPTGTTPVDGTPYLAGDAFGDGTVAYTGSSVSNIFQSGLVAGTEYYYDIYAYYGSGAGINYRTASPLEASQFTVFTQPSMQVTTVTFPNLTETSIEGLITPTPENPTGYLVIYRQGGSITFDPVDGIDYTVGQSLGSSTFVASIGSSLSFIVSGLVVQNNYTFNVLPYNGNGVARNYKTNANNFSSGTLSAPPANQPTNITFTNVTTSSPYNITVNYTASSGSPSANGYIVLRKSLAYTTATPKGGTIYTSGNAIGDATIAYVGSNNNFIDNNLSPATEYYYSIFAYRGTGSEINYKTIAPLQGFRLSGGVVTEPTTQATSLVFSNISSGTFDVSFTGAAAPSPAGYVVLRKASVAILAATIPADGTFYSVGATINADAQVAYIGSSNSFSETQAAATTYNYKVFSFNGSSTATNYFTGGTPLSGSVTTLDTQPTNAPTGISFSSITTSSFTVNYVAPVSGILPTGYLAIRGTGGFPTSVPVDGATYALNNPFGDGTIAYVGGAISFPQSSLASANDYYYKIYSYKGGGATTNYLTSPSLGGNQALLDAQPTQQPSLLVFSAIGSNSLTGTFSEPVSIPGGYIAIANKGSAPTQLPVDGVAYSAGQTLAGGNYVAYTGTNLLFIDTNLDDASNYFYKVYAYSGSGSFINYLTTSPLANNAFTFAQEPSSPALTPVFSNVTVNSLDLSFTSGGNAAQYLVVRKKDSAPTGILSDGSVYTVNTSFGDGTIVQIGPALSLSQSGLEEGANYFYSVYPFNGSAGTTNYLVVNVLTGNQQTIQYVAPSLQPTGFTTSDVSANSFSVTFTPSIATEGYIVLRKTVSSPASVPVNGTTYAINGTFADGSDIVSVGSATTFLQTGLTGATAYFYDVYAYNGFGVYTKFKTVSPLEGSGATLQTEPGGQPTNLLFSNVSTNSFGVSFTAATASPSANGYLVLRNDIESPQFIPQDGTIYSMANAKQSDGSDVVQFGNISTFTETGLSPGKKYYYKVFSLRGTGATTNYLADFPLEGNQSTSQISAPTSQPTSLSFSSITETGLQVSFTAASGGPGGYLAIRRNGSAPTGTPQNDNVYNVGDAIGDGIVAFFDNATSFSDAGLNPGTTYFYKIFSYNRDGGQVKVQLASPLNGSQSTSAAQPSDQATALSFGMVTNNSLDVSFSAASSSPAGYLVLRRSGSVSTDFPVDGVNYTVGSALVSSTIAFVGSGLTFSESGLTSATNYFYSVFSFNGSGNSINYLTTAPLTSNIKTLALEPASQPTALVFSTLTATSLNVSFSAATGSPIGYIVLKRATAPPTETPVDGTSYTAGNLLGSSTIASVGGGLSFSESGLTAATVYYYKIFSFNGTAETVNYKVDNPLTASQSTLPAAPSSQAESITFSTITSSSIKVSFTNGNGNSRLLVAKSGSVVDGLPVNTTTYTANNAFGSGSPIGTGNFVVGIGSGSQTIAGLKPGTNYHFQVFEFNGTGGLENYNTTVATGNPAFSTIPLDTSKPLVTDKTNGIISSGNNISIVVTLTDTESEIAAAKVMFKAISGGAFTPLDLTAPTSGLDYTQTIPWNISFDLGVEYKFEVTNGAGLKNETVPLKTVKVISGSGLTIPCNCAGTSEENYKVIAVPLDLANNTVGSVFDELMPFDESKWRISHYENGDNKELIASSPIEPGKGYWLLVAEPGKTFNTGSGNSVSAASDSQFSVDLKTGWNQIGNPYNYNLSWADMQAANTGFSGVKLRKYSGGWSDGTQLNKMEGAFIEASASQTKLIFPVTKNASINGRISDEIKSPQYPLNNNNWQVYLNIEQGGWSSKISGVGMNEDALVGKDIFDGFAMPRMFKSYLEANHIKKSSDIYSFDVVPTSENHIWDMEVESNLKDDIKFSWDNSYFGSNDRELYLFDVALQLGIDMRRTNSYTIRRDISKSFKVLFGHKDFIKEQTSVERLVLHSLSPNPTEGDVTISFTLPGVQQDYNIDVEVVNLMGIKIWSYSNTMQSGFHKIIWRRDQPETGALYLVKVKAGSMTDAKKLIIIR